MIYESLVILFFILIVIRSILSEIKHQKLIELSAQRLARKRQTKQPKQKRYIFIEDEDTELNAIMAESDQEDEEFFM